MSVEDAGEGIADSVGEDVVYSGTTVPSWGRDLT